MNLYQAYKILSASNAKELEGKLNTLIVTEGIEATSKDMNWFLDNYQFLEPHQKVHIAMSAVRTCAVKDKLDSQELLSIN